MSRDAETIANVNSDSAVNSAGTGADSFPPGTIVNGKYRVERVLGRGGMGVVMAATHLQLDDKVAIKFLIPSLLENAEAVARFEREARALFKIRSENVCQVMDVGRAENGAPYMVMELLEGEDLANLLGRLFSSREHVHVDAAVDYALQACRGMAEAHVRGIVHRDLKPENLFLTHRGVIKLLDFGLSKSTQDATQGRARKLTADAQVMGTPHYMAPEQWMSSKDVGAAADQWSLAIILYELLALRPPFDGDQIAKICSQVLNAPCPDVSRLRPGIPPGFDAVLRKALDKNPSRRYANVGAFAMALSAFGRSGSALDAERTLAMFEDAPPPADSFPSGRYRPLTLGGASDMIATVPDPRQAVAPMPDRVRTQTASSWQKLAGPERGRSAMLLAVVVVALVAFAAISTFGIAREPAQLAGGTFLPDVELPASSPAGAEPTATATATATASVSVSVDALPPPPRTSPKPPPKPTPKAVLPKPKPKPTGPQPKSPPDPNGDLFGDRF